MFKCHNLVLPKSNIKVTLVVFVPKNIKKEKMSTIYFFDGQNTYLDTQATYGRALRAHKKLNKYNMLGVAITGYYNEDDRDSTYCPFKLYEEHKPEICEAFIDDIESTIIPFIHSNYNVYDDMDHQLIYGSSLAAITALYIGFKKDLFKYIAAFSTATFVDERKLFDLITKNRKDRYVYLYVGDNESSDNKFKPLDFLLGSNKLYDLLKINNIPCEFKTKKKGIHNEKYWGKYIKKFYKYYKKTKADGK